MSNKMSGTSATIGGCVVIAVALALGVGLFMLAGALGVASANSWFFRGNFSDGWAFAWDKPFVLFGWSALFLGVVAGIFKNA